MEIGKIIRKGVLTALLGAAALGLTGNKSIDTLAQEGPQNNKPTTIETIVDKVIVNGLGGVHDELVEQAFRIGYFYYNGTVFPGTIIRQAVPLESSLIYARDNGFQIVMRSTTGMEYYSIEVAPRYKSVQVIMPSGSNSFIFVYNGPIDGNFIITVGAGAAVNETGYYTEFFDNDPISNPLSASTNFEQKIAEANKQIKEWNATHKDGDRYIELPEGYFSSTNSTSGPQYSSYSNGFIAGLIAFIANFNNSSIFEARIRARASGSEGGVWDIYNGYGRIDVFSATPVELEAFTASLEDNVVNLYWRTATEVNNYGFDVERRTDSTEYKFLGFVEGHGNSNSPKEYSFIDRNLPPNGTLEYRLKQIDNDGTIEYYNAPIIELLEPDDYVLYQNYPNPFNPSTTIEFEIPYDKMVNLTVYDVLGRKVAEPVNEMLENGRHKVNFNASNLSSGMYFYILKTEDFREAKKFTVIK